MVLSKLPVDKDNNVCYTKAIKLLRRNKMETYQIEYKLHYCDPIKVNIRAKNSAQALVILGQQFRNKGIDRMVSNVGTPIPTRLL